MYSVIFIWLGNSALPFLLPNLSRAPFKVILPWLWKSCPLCNVFSSRSIIPIFATNNHIWYKWSLAWEGVLYVMTFDLDLYLQDHSTLTLKIASFPACCLLWSQAIKYFNSLRPSDRIQGSALSFLAGCPKSHFLGWYRNFLAYWYLKLDNQVVNPTCPKDKLGWIWRADNP